MNILQEIIKCIQYNKATIISIKDIKVIKQVKIG